MHAKSLQSCPTLCNPMDCSPPGSSVHGILQARILQWVPISFSTGSSQFSLVTQSCDPMDCSPPGSSVHGVIQVRTLEWVAIPSSSGSSRPRDRTHVSYVWCIGRRFLYHWATILSGAISNCSVLLSGNILDTFQPGGLIFWWSFCLFILFMVFSWQEC